MNRFKGLKKIFHALDLKDYLLIGLLSLVFSLLFNLPLYRLVYAHDTALTLALAFAVSFFLVYLLFMLLSLQRIVFAVITPILFYMSSVASYFVVFHRVYINENTIAVLMETDPHEAAGLLGLDMVLWVSLQVLFSVLMIYIFFKKTSVSPLKKRLALILVLALFLPSLKQILGFMPYNFAYQGYKYYQQAARYRAIAQNRKPLPPAEVRYEGKSGLTVIFLLGEAARADHFRVNGYGRPTSPAIEAWKAVSLPHVSSCETVTRISVPCIFTRSRPDDIGRELLEFSFISVFRKAGFFTAWISNQGQLGTHNTPVSVIADEAEKVIYQNTTGNTDGGLTVIDEELFPRMREILSSGPGNRLIVLHLLGSHWRYEYHYPDAFRRFTPVCRGKNPASCPRGELVNSYDNSILYTDHVIGEVIRMVRDRDALVLYVSDHGESLGEEGRYLHSPGSKAPEQYRAAMFVWASESYRRVRPDRYRNLVSNRNRSLDHGIIFPSVLDGAGIRTPLADLSKSIFSPMK